MAGDLHSIAKFYIHRGGYFKGLCQFQQSANSVINLILIQQSEIKNCWKWIDLFHTRLIPICAHNHSLAYFKCFFQWEVSKPSRFPSPTKNLDMFSIKRKALQKHCTNANHSSRYMNICIRYRLFTNGPPHPCAISQQTL